MSNYPEIINFSPAILAKNKIYAGIPDDDVALALAICNKYGLDPLLKHIVLIAGNAKNESGQYVKRYNVYITRDGLLHIAHISGKLDCIEVNTGKDELGEFAECVVYRKDMSRPFKYKVYRHEYDSGIGAWKTHPISMLIKTAEVFALRRAFDVALTPIEEMPISDISDSEIIQPENTSQPAQQPTTPQQPQTQAQQPDKNEEPISKAQAARMFALAKGNEKLVRDVLASYGYEHSTDVKKKDYEKICAEIMTGKKEEEKQ